jgi:hypothetical protein
MIMIMIKLLFMCCPQGASLSLRVEGARVVRAECADAVVHIISDHEVALLASRKMAVCPRAVTT